MSDTESKTVFNPDDLFETYVQYFFRRNILGGMRGFVSPVADMSHWIVRTRFLLATIPGEHLDALFEVQYDYIQRESHCTAAFIAGMLNDTRHIERIGTLTQQGGNFFYSAAFFGALLLFKTPDAIQPVVNYLGNTSDQANDNYHNSRNLAISTLRIADVIHGTNSAATWASEPDYKNENRLLLRVIDFGNILRGGIAFNHPDELQRGLLQLLHATTSPELVAYGLLSEPLVNHQIKRPVDFNFTKAVQQYLTGQNTIAALEEAITSCHHAADILAALETDMAYKIPLPTIEYAFEKLEQLVPPSYPFYEMYATHLLLRGTARDEKARKLWAKAEALRTTFRRIEQDKFHYVMREPGN